MAHTPGPWSIRFGGTLVGGTAYIDPPEPRELDLWVASVMGNCDREGECRDNAHLIAAAPELLQHLKILAPGYCAGYCPVDARGEVTVHEAICQDIQAVIAKAEGR